MCSRIVYPYFILASKYFPSMCLVCWNFYYCGNRTPLMNLLDVNWMNNFESSNSISQSYYLNSNFIISYELNKLSKYTSCSSYNLLLQPSWTSKYMWISCHLDNRQKSEPTYPLCFLPECKHTIFCPLEVCNHFLGRFQLFYSLIRLESSKYIA